MTVRKLLPRFMFANFIEDLIRCARAEISIGVINSRSKSVSTPTPCGFNEQRLREGDKGSGYP